MICLTGKSNGALIYYGLAQFFQLRERMILFLRNQIRLGPLSLNHAALWANFKAIYDQTDLNTIFMGILLPNKKKCT